MIHSTDLRKICHYAVHTFFLFLFILKSTSVSDGFNVKGRYSSAILMDRECAALVIWRYLARNAASFRRILTDTIYIFFFSIYQVQTEYIGSSACSNPTAAVKYYYYYYYYYYYLHHTTTFNLITHITNYYYYYHHCWHDYIYYGHLYTSKKSLYFPVSLLQNSKTFGI